MLLYFDLVKERLVIYRFNQYVKLVKNLIITKCQNNRSIVGASCASNDYDHTYMHITLFKLGF